MTANEPNVTARPGGPLRIAFFVTNFPKLSEIFLLNQALALLDRGHEVHIHALTSPREPRVQPGTERIPAGHIHVAGMPRGALARLAALPGLVARNRPGEVLKCLDPLRQSAEAITLRNLFRLDSVRGGMPAYDVAHAQLGSVARQCALLKRLGRLDAPLVASFRGSDLSRYLAHGMPGAYDDVFREAAFCLPVAERWIEPLVKLGCPREKIRHLPSGIPVSRIPVRSLDDWGREDFPRIVSACRLERYKGIHLALDAFALLLGNCPGATYEIYGDGPERPALEAKAQRLGIAGRVRWHGAAHHAEILEALGRCDLHWFTTVTRADGRTEGVPNILKETQAAGLPAVAFDHPGADEVVLHGETGLLVPEGDVRALAEASARLVADGALARRMGELARGRAREKYDLARLTDRLEQIYYAAVRGGAGQP
jgi:colanic acid/amylovoran biosynthesis glycosyltransferase